MSQVLPAVPDAVEPAPAIVDRPGVGGTIRARPGDFVVRERPAYAPDGRRDAHVLFTLTKRDLTTEDAVREVALHLSVARGELGIAGLKDRHAVTTQWVSAPAAAATRLASFAHPEITLGPAHPHGNKLRRGHLLGNEFEITLRDLSVPPPEAEARARATLARLQDRGGLDNLFGAQRFGAGGRNARDGLERLRAGRRGRRADFLLSAGQSVVFNLYLLERRREGTLRRVLEGDVLQKVERGGLFTSSDPSTDQARLDAGELVITGPMFGSRMKAPPRGSPADGLECRILQRCEVSPAALAALGKSAPGTRRPLLVPVEHATAGAVHDEYGPGLRLSFGLPAGSYATVLLREIQGLPAVTT